MLVSTFIDRAGQGMHTIAHQHRSTGMTPRALPRPRLAAGLRARVWVPARCFFSRANAQQFCWLWLLRDDGRVQALRLDANWLERDDQLPVLAGHFADEAEHTLRDTPLGGIARRLSGAPVVPVPRWAVSWGHPLQQAIRDFAVHLDDEVLATLGRLEEPGPFLGSADNYNRLATLPARQRRHRLQALEQFPPLLVPLLLDVHGRPDLFDTDEDEPVHRAPPADRACAPVLDAIDRGRDLTGALAAHYRVDRALVRSPPMRVPWVRALASIDALRLLGAIPAHARPRQHAHLEQRLDTLQALPLRLRGDHDTARLARAFATGWRRTWRALERDFGALENPMRDTRDFLHAALEQYPRPDTLVWLDMETLALAWIARCGLHSLLEASRRWHDQPLRESMVADGLPDAVSPVVGEMENTRGRATELVTRQALHDEGETMHHCIGGYWSQCVRDPARVVHLQRSDGETATALYTCNGSADDPRFVRQDLRGPCNEDVSPAMQRLARDVDRRFDAEATRAARVQAVDEAHRARAATRAGGARFTRPLEACARARLPRVLAYAAAQTDWQARNATLYAGPVAGFHYAEGPHCLPRLAAGEPLQLVREPANPHDASAVRIDWRGYKLGYLPRQANTPIARLLDARVALVATLDGVDATNEWSPLSVCVARPA